MTQDFSSLAFYGPIFFSNWSSPKDIYIYICLCSQVVLQDPDPLTLLMMMTVMEIINLLMASVWKVFTMSGFVIRASFSSSLRPYELRNLCLHFRDEYTEAQRGSFTCPGSQSQ